MDTFLTRPYIFSSLCVSQNLFSALNGNMQSFFQTFVAVSLAAFLLQNAHSYVLKPEQFGGKFLIARNIYKRDQLKTTMNAF
jgi:hypothetical protein